MCARFNLEEVLSSQQNMFFDKVNISKQDFLYLIQGQIDELSKRSEKSFGIKETDPVTFLSQFFACLVLKKQCFLISDYLTDYSLEKLKDDFKIEYIIPTGRISSFSKCQMEISLKDSVFYIFSSGSSGRTKAIAHNYSNIINAVQSFDKFYGVKNIIWQHSLPLYHVSGLMGFMRAFLLGGSYDLLGDKANCISLVPAQLLRFLESDKRKDLNKYQLVLLGGQSLSESLFQAAVKQQVKISYSYGMSETMAQVSGTPIGSFSKDCGEILPGKEIKTIDGKIAVKANSNCLYIIDPIDGKIELPSDGYLVTSDLGEVKNHCLMVLGRADEVFISRGENINPFMIERVLKELPQVEECLVVPKACNAEVLPVCFIQVNTSIELQELQVFVKKKLGSFYIPKYFFTLDDSLRKEGIKIRRNELKELAQVLTQEDALK